MPFHFRCQEVCKNIVMQVWPLDNGDQLPMPSPKVLPKKSQRPRVRMRRRHSGPRAEPAAAELALSTIAEESSQHHSTSSVSVDIEPETFVEESAMSTSPPPYTGVTQSAPAVTVASPACCVCHAARVRKLEFFFAQEWKNTSGLLRDREQYMWYSHGSGNA